MSILLSGIVFNVYQTPEKISKRTGEAYGGRWKVEILSDFPLETGGSKNEIVTLTIEDPRKFESLKGKRVNLPVGIFAKTDESGRAELILFLPKDVKIPNIPAAA